MPCPAVPARSRFLVPLRIRPTFYKMFHRGGERDRIVWGDDMHRPARVKPPVVLETREYPSK